MPGAGDSAMSWGGDERHAGPTVEALDEWRHGHEALCAQRHGTTNDRLSRIEKIIMATFGAVILGGCTIGWAMFKVLTHLP
jgi:hypothetical protein